MTSPHALPSCGGRIGPALCSLTNIIRAVSFLVLMADIAEIVPISQGIELFHYMEQIMAYVRSTHDFTKPGQAKLRLLALCNNLLSRLSRVQHVQLAGRIHLLLSYVLPTIDRSAVNLGGNVNEANPVTVEEVPEVFFCLSAVCLPSETVLWTILLSRRRRLLMANVTSIL